MTMIFFAAIEEPVAGGAVGHPVDDHFFSFGKPSQRAKRRRDDQRPPTNHSSSTFQPEWPHRQVRRIHLPETYSAPKRKRLQSFSPS